MEPVRPSGSPGVLLLAQYASEREAYNDNKGKIKYRTRRERLVVKNRESATDTARGLEVRIEAAGQGDAPQIWNEDGIKPDLPPGAEYAYPLMTHMGIAPAWIVTMTWHDEQGEAQSTTQTVSY